MKRDHHHIHSFQSANTRVTEDLRISTYSHSNPAKRFTKMKKSERDRSDHEQEVVCNFCGDSKCVQTVCSKSELLDTSLLHVQIFKAPSPSPPSCSCCCRPPWPSARRAGTATGSPPRTPSGSRRRRPSTARSPSLRTRSASRPPQTPSWNTHALIINLFCTAAASSQISL